MKRISVFLLAGLVGLVAGGQASAGTLKVDLSAEDFAVESAGVGGANYVVVSLPSLSLPAGSRVESAYLYVDLSAARDAQSEHAGELLTLCVAPYDAQTELTDDSMLQEYTLLPGVARTCVFDVTGMIRAALANDVVAPLIAIKGCDEREEGYIVSLPQGAQFASRLEVRYVRRAAD
jgi:hypothetical protein